MLNIIALDTCTNELKLDVDADDLPSMLRNDKLVFWVDFEAATEEENQLLARVFEFHPLAIEDCINIQHHPKLDKYDDYLFLVLHAVNFSRKQGEEMSTLEIDLFLGKNYIVTYHRTPIRSIIASREKCIRKPEDVMGRGSDLLMHTIVDAMVDNYSPTLTLLEHDIDLLEDDVLEQSTEDLLSRVVILKKDVMYLKRVLAQQRSTIYKLAHTSLALVAKESQMYFSDIYDQIYKFSDQLESFRDILNGVVELCLSLSSVKMNQVVKTLTAVMAVIMPLTLISGIYGMNFKYMPELSSPYGYYAVLCLMLIVGISITLIMKHKKWF